MKPDSLPFLSVKTPVFPDTDTSWMMSGSGSSLSEPWNAISGLVDSCEPAGPTTAIDPGWVAEDSSTPARCTRASWHDARSCASSAARCGRGAQERTPRREAERHRERVGGVGAQPSRAGQQHRHHARHLVLTGAAVTGDGAL